MSVRLSSLAAERRLSGMRSNTPDPSAEVRSGSPGAPAQASKFATVLVRTRTQRRPSTTTMFSNSPNPFAGPDGGASAVAKEAMGGKGRCAGRQKGPLFFLTLPSLPSPFKDAPAESTAAPSIVMRDDQSEPARELEMLAQFRAREVTLAKARTAQHPFRYMGSASPGVGDARSTEGVRLAPAEWEAQFASYTDWELEMLQKLGKVAAIMLGNDSLSSREKEARLDMVAAEELVKKPRMSRSPSAEVPERGPPLFFRSFDVCVCARIRPMRMCSRRRALKPKCWPRWRLAKSAGVARAAPSPNARRITSSR